MKNPTIYSLQSKVRRLSKTRKLAKKNAQKIKDLEKQIYDIALYEGKIYIATEYAKKLTNTVQEAVEKVYKDTGKTSYQYRNKIKTPEEKFRETVKKNFNINTARRLVNDTESYGKLRGKDIKEIRKGVVEHYIDQLTGFKGIFANTYGNTFVEKNLNELYSLIEKDNNAVENAEEVVRYAYEKIVYEKYYNPQGELIQEEDYKSDIGFFEEASEKMVKAYKRLLKGKKIM